MSSDRFAVLERFAPLFDAPEPSFEAILRRHGRKRRNRRITVGVVGLAFCALVVSVVTALPSDRMQGPAGTGSTVPPTSTRVGFIGLPPEGATPSTPEQGELVFQHFSHIRNGSLHIWVYADGRMIWAAGADLPEGANVLTTGALVQHLTPEGVELFRGRSDPATRELGTWGLPASAWEDQQIRAYVPSRYIVCYEDQNEMGATFLRALPDLVQDSLRDAPPEPGESSRYCTDVTTEEARALAEALNGSGRTQEGAYVSNAIVAWVLRYEIAVRVGDPAHLFLTGSISFEPYLPHGEVACIPCG